MVPSTTLDELNTNSPRRPPPLRVSTPIATPSGIAIATATRKASTASSTVAGRRSLITSDTGNCEVIEVPSLPVNTPRR